MNEATGAFHRLTKVESLNITRDVRAGLAAAVNESVRRGMLQSSAARDLMFKEGTKAIPVEAQMALNTLLRCLSAHGHQVNRENSETVKSLLTAYILERQEAISAIVMDSPPMAKVPYPSTHSRAFDETVRNEIERVGTEIELIAAASTRASNDAAPPVASIVFNAPVGLVQTGAGSFGSSTQYVDIETRERLRSALDKIEALLVSDGDLGDRHLLELVRDAKAEAVKAEPNPHRLKSLVTGVGSAIATIPKLREGYESIKWALSFVGITLP